MKEPPKQVPCGCGKRSVMCVHGADGAFWICRACYEKLLTILKAGGAA